MAEYWYVRISDDAAFNYAIDNDCFLMQYQYEKQERKVVTSNRNCCNQIKSGDWLMLGKDDCIYAVGRACKPKHIQGDTTGFVNDERTAVFYENIDASNGFNGEWGQRIDVEKWQFCLNDGISNGGVKGAAIGGIVQNTVFKIDKDFFDNKKCEMRRKFMKTLGMLEESRLLLIANYNLILTGAPGTGKTYLAKQIAQRLVFGEGCSPKDEKDFSEEERLKFTQQVGFCQFHPSYDYTDFVEGLRPKGNADGASIGFGLRDGVFKAFCREAQGRQPEKFVFIIDEINRGDISKIFGELFYAVDPSYRGEKGRVITQYANLIEDGDVFKNGFYVPRNVFIIGTMNDIDRSVESMDFAMRRRFAWREVTAADSERIIDKAELVNEIKAESIARMRRLNDEIIKPDYQLGSAYQIGGAYFKKMELYNDLETVPAFRALWDHHLSNLLHEYLRGTPKVDQHLKAFKNKYDGVEPAAG
jgi:MoxR-like ATPase